MYAGGFDLFLKRFSALIVHALEKKYPVTTIHQPSLWNFLIASLMYCL